MGVVVAEVERSVKVLFWTEMVELVMSLAGMEVEVIKSFAGRVEVVV